MDALHQPQPCTMNAHETHVRLSAQSSGHLPKYQKSALQAPFAGPSVSPEVHLPVSAHQPHPLAAAQSPHWVSVGQAAASQATKSPPSAQPSAHVPSEGPVAVPGTHDCDAPHQPQPAMAPQLPQSEPPEQSGCELPVEPFEAFELLDPAPPVVVDPTWPPVPVVVPSLLVDGLPPPPLSLELPQAKTRVTLRIEGPAIR
jgi:hypothetical protein